MREYTGEVNGRKYTLAKTSPARLKQLDDISGMLQEYEEREDTGYYLYDEDFRGKFFKKLTDIIFEWKGNTPDEEFFSSDDLEVSEIVTARSVFLARGGTIL